MKNATTVRRGVFATLAIAALSVVAAISCSVDAVPPAPIKAHAWLARGTPTAGAEARATTAIARIHSAGLKDFIARHKALRKQYRNHIPDDKLCSALIASVESQIPATVQATGVRMGSRERKLLIGTVIAGARPCAGRVAQSSAHFTTERQSMSMFSAPAAARAELICDPTEEPTDDECLPDDDTAWEAVANAADAVSQDPGSITATSFTDLVTAMTSQYGGNLTAVDLDVFSDISSVAASSEAEWPVLAEEIVAEAQVSTMSVFRTPGMRVPGQEGFDPCHHLYDDRNLDACRMRVFTKGVSADLFGGTTGLLAAKGAKRMEGKLLKKALGRAAFALVAITESGMAYYRMFDEYVLSI